MKKILVVLVSLLSVILVSCQETSETITTTQIVSTTTEYYNEYYYELSTRLDELNIFDSDFLDISMITNIKSNINSQFTNMRLNTHIQIDNLNDYMYMANYQDSFNIDSYSFIYKLNDQFLSYNVDEDNFLITEDLDADSLDDSLYQFSDLSLAYDMLIDESVHVSKRTDNSYYIAIPILKLLNEANSFYDGLTDLESMDLVDLDDVYMDVVVSFIDAYSFSIDVSIDQISIDSTSVPITVTVDFEQVYSMDPSIVREVLDITDLKIVGPDIPSDNVFIFENGLNNYLYLGPRRSNYFKVYLEPGVYNLDIDLEDSSFIGFVISNENLVLLSDQRSFEVISEGYYYLNFPNSSESELIIDTALIKD